MEKPTQTVDKNTLLAVIMLSSFLNPLMGAAVNVALPNIGAELSMSAVGLSWVGMAFLLTSSVALVPMGKISDLWGRRKVFLYGNILFAVTTLLCALSVSAEMLIISRLLQGLAASGIFATGMALLISAFDVKERGKTIGLNVMAVYIGLSVSPVLGGLLTEWWGWRSIFYINAGAVFFIILAVIYRVKSEWSVPATGRFDYLGTFIFMVSLTGLMYGFSHLPGMFSGLLTVAGLAGMVGFVWYERQHPNPVLDMNLFFKNKLFAYANFSAFINYAATFAITFVLSLYLQYIKGMSPREAGAILIAQPIVMALVSSFSGKLSDKKDPRILASVGMAISTVGLIMLVFIQRETGFPFIIAALMILGFGFGLFSSPNTNAIMSSVDKKYLGLASATVSTMRSAGMMFSMAVAALAVHAFLGDRQIAAENLGLFMQSMQAIMLTFSVLCIIGVYTSMAGRKN